MELYEIQRDIQLKKQTNSDFDRITFIESELMDVACSLLESWSYIVGNLDSVTFKQCIVDVDNEREYLNHRHRYDEYLIQYTDNGLYKKSDKIIEICNKKSKSKKQLPVCLQDIVTTVADGFDYYLDGVVFNLRQKVGVDDFFDITVRKHHGASYCLIHKYQQAPKIVLNTKGGINPLILAYEMGHCIHFYLSMTKQHFYAFEASIYVRESLAFMFEALALVFLCNRSDIGDGKALIESYRNSSGFYLGSRKGLSSGANGSYRKYYPLARVIGEALAVKVITGKITPGTILECLCSGGHLSIEKLVTLAEV